MTSRSPTPRTRSPLVPVAEEPRAPRGSGTPRRGPRKLRSGPRLAAKLALSISVAAVSLEGGLHLFPSLVPVTYRESFPLGGIGFFEHDLLDRTPLEAMPMPLLAGPRDGPPPADLVDYGVAPPEAAARDRRRFPRLYVPGDAVGLPNPRIPAQAPIVLVGDSFLVSASSVVPAGLVRRLRRATGEETYSLGVAAIGPFQERDLLLRYGLPRKPAVVVWLFFAGNDVTDTARTLYHEHHGKRTWGDLHSHDRPPAIFLPGIARFYLERREALAQGPALPGARLPRADGTATELWFHPNELIQATRTREQWEASPGWKATAKVLHEAFESTHAAGARFLLVYLPSKTEVYLRHVEPDAELLWRMANASSELAGTFSTARSFLPSALANEDALEALLTETCAAEGIPFVSARPALDALARRGELGYFVADTHWDAVGQEAFLPVLLEALHGLR